MTEVTATEETSTQIPVEISITCATEEQCLLLWRGLQRLEASATPVAGWKDKAAALIKGKQETTKIRRVPLSKTDSKSFCEIVPLLRTKALHRSYEIRFAQEDKQTRTLSSTLPEESPFNRLDTYSVTVAWNSSHGRPQLTLQKPAAIDGTPLSLSDGGSLLKRSFPVSDVQAEWLIDRLGFKNLRTDEKTPSEKILWLKLTKVNWHREMKGRHITHGFIARPDGYSVPVGIELNQRGIPCSFYLDLRGEPDNPPYLLLISEASGIKVLKGHEGTKPPTDIWQLTNPQLPELTKKEVEAVLDWLNSAGSHKSKVHDKVKPCQ